MENKFEKKNRERRRGPTEQLGEKRYRMTCGDRTSLIKLAEVSKTVLGGVAIIDWLKVAGFRLASCP